MESVSSLVAVPLSLAIALTIVIVALVTVPSWRLGRRLGTRMRNGARLPKSKRNVNGGEQQGEGKSLRR